MPPTLFSLHTVMVGDVQRCLVGVTVLYKADGRLIGSRAKQDEAKWSELQFSDDIAITATSYQKMELTTSSLAEVTSSWGLTISTTKTEAMVINWQQ